MSFSSKKYFVILAALTGVISILLIWRNETKGFRPHKIIGKTSFADFEVNTEETDENEALRALAKPFRYLNKGSQAYVFESEDKRYVLKLIALNKYKEPFRRKLLGSFHLFKRHREERTFNRKRNLKAALSSYKIAYENLKEETGTVYVHFKENKKFTEKIKLRDRLGNYYEIDPNETLFIVQKKACTIVRPFLLECSNKNDYIQIQKIIADYLHLSDRVLRKGFINRDSSVKNLGLCDDCLMELDIGRFQRADLKDNYLNYLRKYTRLYRKFLEINIPEMVGFFDEKTAELGGKNGQF